MTVETLVREYLGTMRDSVLELDGKVARIEESFDGGLSALAREDVGWQKVGSNRQFDELDPAVLKVHAVQARALRAMNPLVRRGLVVRCAYLFEEPITYPDTADAQKFLDNPVNKQSMFSEEAEDELESALSTDGNYFILVDRRAREVRRIPFHEITGVAVHPEFSSEIQYYLWDRDDDGEPVRSYVPSINLRSAPSATIDDIPVEQGRRIEHVAVGRQSDWRYGVPDLLGAVYWAKAYKEYLEAVFTLNKSLASLAFKATSATPKGRSKASHELRRPRAAGDAGGTAILAAGQDLTAINKAGASADMAAGTPLASMVSACLDIPLSVLLTDGSAGGRQGAENALEDPTIKSMNRRRKIHLESRRRIFAFLGLGEPTWVDLDNFQVHRAMQALELGKPVLHPDEIRAATLRFLRLPATHAVDDVPPPTETVVSQNGTGPLSDGTNDSRDNPGGSTDA